MTVARLEECFASCRAAGRPALVAYLTIGDPSVEDSLECARAALAAGADILELGVPFSDPTADGPVIAAAAHRAIRQGGSLRAALEVARRLRAESSAPLVLFTYYNPVLAVGDVELPRLARNAGIDGLLLVDLPPEEGAVLRDAAASAEVAVIPLLTPTSDASRSRAALARASGFVYYVSVTGVTGSGAAPLEAAGQRAARLSEECGLPVVVGFGIDSPEKARLVADQGAQGVVVGTAIVRAIAGAKDAASRRQAVAALVGSLSQAIGSTSR